MKERTFLPKEPGRVKTVPPGDSWGKVGDSQAKVGLTPTDLSVPAHGNFWAWPDHSPSLSQSSQLSQTLILWHTGGSLTHREQRKSVSMALM